MNHQQNLPPEVWSLVDELLNGQITPEQAAKLDNCLLDNPEAQRIYAAYCQMHLDLTIDHRADNAANEFRKRGALLEENTLTNVTDVTVKETTSGPKGFSAILKNRFVSLAACIFVAILAVALTSLNQNVDRTVSQATKTTTQSHSIPSSVKLKSGSSTTLMLDDVGYIYLEGPADFRLLGPRRARLDSGRIRMRVTEASGRGYVIETPDGDITDLGTEFGVHVATGKRTAVAVFEGAVDLQVADQNVVTPHVQRLVGGDGVLFNKGGQLDRLNSILTSQGNSFSVCSDDVNGNDFDSPLIIDTYDNLPTSATKRYYEIVTKGMKEDALAHVDRLQHNWNGLSSMSGMPKYLIGADYVKTFCDDKRRVDHDFQLTVVLARPAKLYVLFDKRLEPPSWLVKSFRRTDDCLGLDAGKWHALDEKRGHLGETGKGPGESIDIEFVVWERLVDKPGTIELGANGVNRKKRAFTNMYGVAAVEFPARTVARKKQSVKSIRPAAKNLSDGAKPPCSVAFRTRKSRAIS